jgi:hypothetical protein
MLKKKKTGDCVMEIPVKCFKLLAGVHEHLGTTYRAGDCIYTEIPMDKVYKNKFREMPNKRAKLHEVPADSVAANTLHGIVDESLVDESGEFVFDDIAVGDTVDLATGTPTEFKPDDEDELPVNLYKPKHFGAGRWGIIDMRNERLDIDWLRSKREAQRKIEEIVKNG